jgi:uncharacterized membrane protein
MFTVEKSVVIDRPAEEVFAFVSDQTNAPAWQRGLVEVRRTSDGPIGVGTRHTFVRTLMGRTIRGSNEYTRYEPSRLVAFKGTSGAMDVRASYAVQPEGLARSRLTAWLELRSPGLLRLVEPFVAMSLRRDVEANLESLRHLLENATEEPSAIGGAAG